MATPRPHELGMYFASKDLAADGIPLPQRVVTAGSEIKKIACSGLSDAAAYWDGAVGWFYGDTITEALRGRFFHVRSFIGGELTLSKQLPAIPAVGDKFRIWLGGGRASSVEAFGLQMGGVQPELNPVVPANISGVQIVKASPGLLGYTNPLQLYYNGNTKILYIKMYDTTIGPALDVSSSVSEGVIYLDNEEGYIVVNVTAADLPIATSTVNSSWTLTYPKGTFIPDMEGYETSTGPFPKYRYHPVVLRNNGDDMMVNFSVMAERPWKLSTTLATSYTSTNSSADYANIACNATTVANFPTSSFWIRNKTKGDARYVRYRTGNTLVIAQATAAMNLRGTGAPLAWATGDVIEIMSDVDIGIETPNDQLVFSTPVNKYTAPAGVTFIAADLADTAIDAGDLEPSGFRVAWLRETVMSGHRVRKDVVGNLRVLWS